MVRFQRPRKWVRDTDKKDDPPPGTFDLLGFRHFWALSRKGNWVVKRKTAKDRFTRALKAVLEWCRKNRPLPIKEQWQALRRKLTGHYGYYGITGNSRALGRFDYFVRRAWKKWFSRRSQRAYLSGEKFERLLARYPLPAPTLRRVLLS